MQKLSFRDTEYFVPCHTQNSPANHSSRDAPCFLWFSHLIEYNKGSATVSIDGVMGLNHLGFPFLPVDKGSPLQNSPATIGWKDSRIATFMRRSECDIMTNVCVITVHGNIVWTTGKAVSEQHF